MSNTEDSSSHNSNLIKPIPDKLASDSIRKSKHIPEHHLQAQTCTMSPSWNSSESLTGSHLEALFVGDLSYFCSDSDLQRTFQPYGPVHKAVVRKSKTNEPLHYGFIEIPIHNANRAIEELNGEMLLGRKLR